VILSDGNPPKEAIVYVTSDNSQVISTLVKADGNYILPLNSIRGNDFSSYYVFPSGAGLKMLVLGDSQTSNVTLSIDQTRPVPIIILSKDYDFKNSQASSTAPAATSQSFPAFSSSSSGTLKILTPKNNEGFTDQQPLFKGVSQPNQDVKIIIHSDQVIQTTIKTDQTGSWNYRPASSLSPGTHSITVQAKDSSGILQTITQSFVVYAAGQQVNPPAPSPTSTPTPTQALSSKITTVQNVPTATPTVTSAVNFVSSNSGVLITTPVQTKGASVITIAPKTLSKPGNPSIITAGIMGAFISLVGGLLFLLTRGSIQAL
jgi:hypothetical protein